MDLNCFLDAVEELANRLFHNKRVYDNLRMLVDTVSA